MLFGQLNGNPQHMSEGPLPPPDSSHMQWRLGKTLVSRLRNAEMTSAIGPKCREKYCKDDSNNGINGVNRLSLHSASADLGDLPEVGIHACRVRFNLGAEERVLAEPNALRRWQPQQNFVVFERQRHVLHPRCCFSSRHQPTPHYRCC